MSIASVIQNGNTKFKWTDEGGIACRFTNKTGAASVKGTLTEASSSVDNAFVLMPVGGVDCFGIIYEDGIPDGDECWVVTGGIADVFFIGDTTRQHLARMCIATDTNDEAGKAISEAVPSSPFATDKHFGEIGHVLESRVGAGLARCVLHFN